MPNVTDTRSDGPPTINAPAREPMLLALPVVRIFEDEAPMGEFVRNVAGEARRVLVGMRFEGWWCEGRAFGEATFATTYEIEAPPRVSDEADREQIEQSVREIGKVLVEEIAHGKQFFYCETSGAFTRAMLEWFQVKVKAVCEAIARFNEYEANPVVLPEGEEHVD